jgi:predicted metal-dependent enzyme (double-stranded beta helix superfamily)
MLQQVNPAPSLDIRASLRGPHFALAALVADIGMACDGPREAMMGRRIASALREAAADPNLLQPKCRVGSSEKYVRHIIASDPKGRFTVLALVWGPGQFSPPHAHRTWCAYAVAENTLTETLYRFDSRNGMAEPTAIKPRAPGYACFSEAGLDQIHRLGNAGEVPAISIHVYGVEPERIGTDVNRLVDVAE